MDKKQIALSCIKKNFNCAQSTFSTFSENVGIDRETAIKLTACFGGGMKCGEVCGAVTGVLMALGMKYGNTIEYDFEGKQLAYTKGLDFISKFRAMHGSILCRDILGYDMSKPEEMKKVVEKNLHIIICGKAITDAIAIAEEMI